MKIRNDFVTNSSSSNFILGFDGEDDFELFKFYCRELGYNKLIKIVQGMRKYGEQDRDKIKQRIYEICSFDYIDDVLCELDSEYDKKPFMEKIEFRRKVEKDKEYIDKLTAKIVKNTTYTDMISKFDDSSIVLIGTIWDNDDEDKELECMIRNGLLRDKFKYWLITQLDVG